MPRKVIITMKVHKAPDNPFTLNGLFHPVFFPIAGFLVSFYYNCVFCEIQVFNANSVDPDQTPRSVASDLGLHCSPITNVPF